MKNIKNIIGSSPELTKIYDGFITTGFAEHEAIQCLIGYLKFQIEWDKTTVTQLADLLKAK